MKAIKINTTGEIQVITLSQESNLEILQEGVGGWVQAVDLSSTTTLWCNEEGKNLGLPHNPVAQIIWDRSFGPGTDYIVGDVVITGGADDEGETMGLSDEDYKNFLYLAV